VGTTTLRVRPPPERPLRHGDQYRFAEARGDRRGGVVDMDHERATADRGGAERARRHATAKRRLDDT
jgi:hypothetical protein